MSQVCRSKAIKLPARAVHNTCIIMHPCLHRCESIHIYIYVQTYTNIDTIFSIIYCFLYLFIHWWHIQNVHVPLLSFLIQVVCSLYSTRRVYPSQSTDSLQANKPHSTKRVATVMNKSFHRSCTNTTGNPTVRFESWNDLNIQSRDVAQPVPNQVTMDVAANVQHWVQSSKTLGHLMCPLGSTQYAYLPPLPIHSWTPSAAKMTLPRGKSSRNRVPK